MRLSIQVRLAVLSALACAHAAPVHAQQRPDRLYHVATGPDSQPLSVAAFAQAHSARATVSVIESGGGIEADNIAAVAVSGDGAYVLATHAYTDNLTVIDAHTHVVLANVPVGDFPLDVAATATVAVVTNVQSRSVSVVDLATRTVRATIAVPGTPVRVAVTPDGRTAFVLLEGASPFDDTDCQVIDLATDAVVATIPNIPSPVVGIGYTDLVDRVLFTYPPFLVTPGGKTLIVALAQQRLLLSYDIASRSLDASISQPNFPVGLDLSADGRTAVVSNLNTPPRGVWQVDLTTRAVSPVVPVSAGSGAYSQDVVTTADASQAVLARTSGAGSEAVIVRFDGAPPKIVPILPSERLVRSADRRQVLFGGSGLTLLDLDSGSVTWSRPADEARALMAASPTETLFAAGSVYGRENVVIVADAPGGPLVATVETGEAPEGDGPRRILPLPDGRVLVANSLSGTLAVVDPVAGRTDATWALGASVTSAVVTSDGTAAVAVGYGYVHLVDIATGATLASIALPDAFVDVAPTLDGSLVVASGIGYSTLDSGGEPRTVVLRREGAAYVVVRTFEGFTRALAATPDGSVVIVPLDAYPADPSVVFLDGRTGVEIARRLNGSFTSAVAVSSDSRHAAAIESSTGRVTGFDLAPGSVSAGVDFTVPTPAGDLAFVPGVAEVWVGANGALRRHTVPAGDLVESRPVSGEASLVRVAPNGEPVAVLNGFSAAPRLWARGTETALPALVTRLIRTSPYRSDVLLNPFALAAGGDVALLGGVRDRLVVVRALGVAAEDGPDSPALSVTASPNPTAGASTLTLTVPREAVEVRVEVFDVAGRLVRTLHEGPLAAGRHTLAWDGRDGSGRTAASGVYAVRVSTWGAVRTVRLAVVR